jgi:hypothetical protein
MAGAIGATGRFVFPSSIASWYAFANYFKGGLNLMAGQADGDAEPAPVCESLRHFERGTMKTGREGVNLRQISWHKCALAAMSMSTKSRIY